MRRHWVRPIVAVVAVSALAVSALTVTIALSTGRASAANRADPPADGVSSAPYLDPGLLQVDQVTGTILDVSSARILLRDWADAGRLKVSDRAGGVMTALPWIPGTTEPSGRLTADGVLMTALLNTEQSAFHVYAWAGGDDVTDLGRIRPVGSLVVHGSYASWSDGARLSRYHVDTGEMVQIATDAAHPDDVADNGDVAYTDLDGRTWRYRDGSATRLTDEDTLVDSSPLTDGVNVVFTRSTPCCARQRHSVWLYDGTGTFPLTRPMDGYATASDYAVAGGWVAYLADDPSGTRQVWLRGPDGDLTRLSDAGGPRQPAGVASVVAVSPDGETLYTLADRLYVADANHAPLLLAAGHDGWYSLRDSAYTNLATYVDGEAYLAMGGSLLRRSGEALVALSVSVAGGGTVTVSPYGARCRASCDLSFAAGADLALTARTDLPGWRFGGWSGACTGRALTCEVRLDAAASVHAWFRRGHHSPGSG